MEKNKELCPVCRPETIDTTHDIATWLMCDACSIWYHAKCVDIKKPDMIERFHCLNCVVTHGPSTSKNKNKK